MKNGAKDAAIPGLKLIRHNYGGVNNVDDPTLPFHLDVSLRPPSFLRVANAVQLGNEVLLLRGQTRKALEQFVAANELEENPRLESWRITQTAGWLKPDPE